MQLINYLLNVAPTCSAALLLTALISLCYFLWRHPSATLLPEQQTRISDCQWHKITTDEALLQLKSNLQQGLSQTEANLRLAYYGSNRITEQPPIPVWYLFLAQFKGVLILVLIVAAILATFIGDINDGIVILIVVFINAFLGFYQEYQAEKSLAALKKLLTLQATVRRDSNTLKIAAHDLVPGDIVLLEAGDKIPADGRILTAQGLEADESSLTGESMPVSKHQQQLDSASVPLDERFNMLYMNNAVTRGRAELLITATGMNTEIGKLASLLAQTEKDTTPLQQQLDNLGKRLALIALFIVVILFTSRILQGEPLIETAFIAIALAVAAIPEGLPAVVTVTLALGMHRLAKQRAIIKRLSAVETLGCTTVICTDKTGTLTLNQMAVRALYIKNAPYQVSTNGEITTAIGLPRKPTTDFNNVYLALTLCNDSHLQQEKILGDPMEGALLKLAGKAGFDKTQSNLTLPRIAEIPFDAQHKFMATFHSQNDTIQVFVKGAPEVLLAMCTTMLDKQDCSAAINQTQLLEENARMAKKGLRVLGLAFCTLSKTDFNTELDLFSYVKNLCFIGLIGLMDPPRPEAKAAIELCMQAGIDVKMITGDQPLTAASIAQELGLTGETITGAELLTLSDASLQAQINTISVFARTTPAQKVRIVNALKMLGHIVAMTGDGVNDAPALKNADIGIAMGISGTDVAKEAANMILTDDNFATIVKAVKEGRGIYENMIKFIRFQLSTNIGAILSISLAPLFNMPIPFTAIQLLWINIIMDGPPAMSLGFDPAHSGSMNEPPRKTDAQILSGQRLGNLFSYGLIMTLGTLGILYYGLQTGDSHYATSLAFTTFVLFQIFNVFNARSERGSAFNCHFFSNTALWLSIIAVITLQIIIMEWPVAEAVFHTTALTAKDWLLATLVAGSIIVFEETRKLFTQKISR